MSKLTDITKVSRMIVNGNTSLANEIAGGSLVDGIDEGFMEGT